MAKPTTLPFGKMLIKVLRSGGNADTPGDYVAPCGLTTKAFNQSVSTQETTVPDCDDPDAIAYVERLADSKSAEISGSGVLAMESRQTWEANLGVSNTYRVFLDATLADHGGYWQGNFVLTTFNVAADRGQKIRGEVTLQSDGEYAWHDADA
jgi:hypothetical protein